MVAMLREPEEILRHVIDEEFLRVVKVRFIVYIWRLN